MANRTIISMYKYVHCRIWSFKGFGKFDRRWFWLCTRWFFYSSGHALWINWNVLTSILDKIENGNWIVLKKKAFLYVVLLFDQYFFINCVMKLKKLVHRGSYKKCWTFFTRQLICWVCWIDTFKYLNIHMSSTWRLFNIYLETIKKTPFSQTKRAKLILWM